MKAFGDLTPAQTLDWASSRLPPWAALVLVLILAWLLADLVWTLWPKQNAQPGPAAASSVANLQSPVNEASRVDTARIKAANLFGSYVATNEPVAQSDVTDAPETRLRLELKGTGADRDQSRAFAIIGENGGDDKVYRVGDEIPGNASLHAVYPDRVLLRRAGKIEALTLKTLLDKKSTNTAARNRRQTASASNRPEGMRQLRQQLMANPAQITDIIRPQPVYANGQQLGYRVYPGRDRQKFVELGLRPGDLVTEINGSALNDPAQGQQLLKQITESDVINLTIQRSGQTQTLTLRMDN